MYPHREYLFAASLVFGGALVMTGCSQPDPTAPSAPPTSEQPAAGTAAPQDTVEVVPPQEGASTPENTPESSSESDASTSLPEVRGVNTAQLGELVEETLGKVTVLNIWATWCGPCVREMPDLVKFYNETSRDTVAFLSLSIDMESDITAAIPAFQRTHEMPFPIYVLTERNDQGLAKALRAPFEGAIPATYIYDGAGTLVKTVLGAITLAELQAIVEPLATAKP